MSRNVPTPDNRLVTELQYTGHSLMLARQLSSHSRVFRTGQDFEANFSFLGTG